MRWVIQCFDGTFWLEEGGVTDNEVEAEHFDGKVVAVKELDKWCHPEEAADVVACRCLR